MGHLPTIEKKSPGSISDVSGADFVASPGGGPQTPGGFDAPSRRLGGGFPDGEITAAKRNPQGCENNIFCW